MILVHEMSSGGIRRDVDREKNSRPSVVSRVIWYQYSFRNGSSAVISGGEISRSSYTLACHRKKTWPVGPPGKSRLAAYPPTSSMN